MFLMNDEPNSKSIRRKLTLGISTIDKELSFLECKNKSDDNVNILFNVHDDYENPVENANISLKK